MSLGELVRWYHTLPEVGAKKSWKRDVQLLRSVARLLGVWYQRTSSPRDILAPLSRLM
jgi:hypothetical protein